MLIVHKDNRVESINNLYGNILIVSNCFPLEINVRGKLQRNNIKDKSYL